ncbi:MAG: hypothetical protein C4524_00645 [Candidatus Zixiibacteriota bacterium]|nr:MAG: hypothetical protein C4524_00645 [candidate division Zixibacteria bacterium]
MIRANQPIHTRRLALVILGVVILLELGFRAIGAVWLNRPFWDDRKYVPDEHLIWKLNPGYSGIWNPLFPHLKINRQGLVGPEPSRPKDPGTVRIIILGGSVQFGFGIHDFDSTSYSFLARRLRERESMQRKYELLNASAPGYSSHNGLQFVRHKLARHEADVLIMGFGGNDGAFDLAPDKDPAKDWSVSDMSIGGALTYSCILRWEETLRENVLSKYFPHKTVAFKRDFPRRVPLSDFRDNLRACVEDCRARGVEPILLVEPHPHGVSDPTGKVATHQAYQEAIRRVAGDMGVILADADSVLQHYPVGEVYPDPTVQFFYPSIRGQEVMAEVMLEALERAGAVKPEESAPAPLARE